MKIASVDSILAKRLDWLESLQRKRQAHIEELIALVYKKQLEIDNLRARLR